MRTNFAENVGKTGFFIGRLSSESDNIASMESWDGEMCKVILTGTLPVSTSRYYRIEGEIVDDMTFKQTGEAVAIANHDARLAHDVHVLLGNEQIHNILSKA